MAPRKCDVIGCTSRGSGDPDIHYHGLPGDPATRDKWMQWLAIQNNNKNLTKKHLTICSLHFHPSDRLGRKLRTGAIPSDATRSSHSQSTSVVVEDSTSQHDSNIFNKSCGIAVPNAEYVNVGPDQEYSTVVSVDVSGRNDDQVVEDNMDYELSGGAENAVTEVYVVPEGFKVVLDTHYDLFPFELLAENVTSLFSEVSVTDNDGIFNSDQVEEAECNLETIHLDTICEVGTSILSNTDETSNGSENCIAHSATSDTVHLSLTSNKNTSSAEKGKQQNRIKSNKQRKCAALDCQGSLQNKYFTFPAIFSNNKLNYINLERCKSWIANCGNISLLGIATSKLHSSYFLCSEHFDTNQFYSRDRKTLLSSAVPSLFLKDHLSEEDMILYPNLSPSEVMLASHLFAPVVSISNDEEDMDNITSNLNNTNIQDELQINFEKHMETLKWVTCPDCKEKFCVAATSQIKCLHGKKNCRYYSLENDMDPLDVPEELKSLTYVEEQLIALVHPMISVFKLSGHHQYGYRGNIINFPQDVKSFAKTLPHNIETLSSLITVRTGDDIKPVDFNVRAGKIRDALLWLKQNNCYYTDIEISEDNISRLPTDGNVFDQVTRVINVDSEAELENDSVEMDNEDYVNTIIETCIPSLSQPTSTDKAETILKWPTIGKDAINEFKTPGYIAMAFPTLFPYGKADLKNPREYNITPKLYFKHLMNYHDGRFAKHPRFKYFALNSEMRWNALKLGGVFVKKNSEFQDMDLDQLKEKLKENPNLLKKILFYNSSLRGTRSYWYARGQELLAMIEQLGLPTLFFTLSAADLHWPDLFHNIAPDEDISTMTETRRRKLIEENPLKVDAFFMKRGENFINEVLRKKFDVKDLWFRIEYQHRGSPHIHGVLYLKDAPKFDDLTKETPERRQEIADYFDKFVSTTHPDIHCPKGPIHPCRKRLSEVINLEKDLAELLNRVQRHTEHRDGYCIRRNKKTKKKECRFKFPKDLAEKTEIKMTEDNGVELVTARNDPCLNKYNQYILQTWRANIDVSPVLSRQALVNYLAKYVTKSETKSQEMTDLLHIIMNKNSGDKTAKSIIQQLYIQSCCERDISAQETCHLLMGLCLTSSGGRQFVSINFKVLESDCWVLVSDDENRNCKSFIEKYMERPSQFEDKSLWYMAKHIILPKGRKRAPGKEAIIQVYPKLSKSVLTSDPEAYYRQKVLLFVPWRYEDYFMQHFSTWEEAYRANEELITGSFTPACDLDGEQPDDPEYENIDDSESSPSEQWMCISSMGPSNIATKVELGRREVDLAYNWHEDTLKYQQFGTLQELTSFLPNQKKNLTTATDVPQMPNVEFTTEQKSVLDLLRLQIDSIKEGTSAFNQQLPKSVIVQGKAGTGKSLLIHAMKSIIHEAFGSDAFCLLGPTGVSALNINGSTIHSKLYIHPKTREVLPLKGNAVHEFRKKFEKIQFVIIDEYSMVGCNMLNLVEKRLKEAMDRDDQLYGGVFVYFFGDIQQLAPVGDSAAYKDNQLSVDYINGKLLYNSVDAAINLSQVKRQNDSRFLDVLNNISSGTLTDTDYNTLKERFTTSLSKQEIKSFDDAIHLFPTRAEVDEFNKDRLESLKDTATGGPRPIARIPAKHNCPGAKNGTENEAGGLRDVLYLSKGAKVMLRANIWTERGLVNGSIGTIVDILYADDTKPPEDAPVALICKFDSYQGPYLDENKKTVVITPIAKQWKSKNGQDCVREQFPLSLCYSCSIHKSQGLTLDKACVNIGLVKEMSPGLTYTALSRVRSLSGLLLVPFSKKRILSINDKKYIHERAEWITMLNQKKVNFSVE